MNTKTRFRMSLAFLASMSIMLSFLTSCEYFVDVDFQIACDGNDTLVFIGWSGRNEVRYPVPCTSNSGDVHHQRTISSCGVSGGPNIFVTDEQAFNKLMSDYDSVMLTRGSDGASTIVFCHDQSATEEQRYFFTREAWNCDPEGETEKDRTYTLILKDEMFKCLVFPAVDPEFVDLGLPSGTLWATFNVGATAPEGCGFCYAWGETAPKSFYSMENNKYCVDDIYYGGLFGDKVYTKYYCYVQLADNGWDTIAVYTDSREVLEPIDDAATANWGGDWRTPTVADWVELGNNCTCTWTEQNGVEGRLYTGTNGNSMFLPYAHLCEGGNEYTHGESYWSSNGVSQAVTAFSLSLDCMYPRHRSHGLPVRAVRSTKQ